MKIGTDAVLLGAWADVDGATTIWDVGCGSGVIALMLAQRTMARIVGIEIVSEAAEEALANFNNSKWSDRMSVMAGDVKLLWPSLPCPDLIVSNPPYFDNALQAPDAQRNVARHQVTISIDDLIRISSLALAPGGRLAMVLPTDRSDEVEWLARLHGLAVERRADISTSNRKPPTRTLWQLAKTSHAELDFSLHRIYENGAYSDWYKSLTFEYLLWQ